MAKIKILGSSSKGNCYILRCKDDILIIELGVNWENIIKALNYGRDIDKVVGCIVTHKHLDHSRSIPQATKHRLGVYSCKETAEEFGVKALEAGKKYKIGSFFVMPLAVEHSCECYAYIIEHKDMGRMLFATDLEVFPYYVRGINHFFIEANYSQEVLIDNHINADDGKSHPEHHMEFNDCISAIKASYSPSLQNIVLIHLSDKNSDKDKFRLDTIEEFATDNVFIAEEGLELELNESEF